MRTELQQQTITLLQKLGKKGSVPEYQHSGICHHVSRFLHADLHDIFPAYVDVTKRWRYYSGNLTFPVPPSKTEYDNYSAAGNRYAADNHWSGTYGDMRRMFARYLVREFSKLYPVEKK